MSYDLCTLKPCQIPSSLLSGVYGWSQCRVLEEPRREATPLLPRESTFACLPLITDYHFENPAHWLPKIGDFKLAAVV
jgi:hypothetical protein